MPAGLAQDCLGDACFPRQGSVKSRFFGSTLLVVSLGEMLDALLDALRILLQLVVGNFRRGFFHRLAPTICFRRVVYDFNLSFALAFNFNLKFFRLFCRDFVGKFEITHVLLLMPA
jgi:hypothetical protein